jgi:hypothetical protein
MVCSITQATGGFSTRKNRSKPATGWLLHGQKNFVTSGSVEGDFAALPNQRPALASDGHGATGCTNRELKLSNCNSKGRVAAPVGRILTQQN